MFNDALFLPERDLRAKAVALPLAAFVHMVALALLVMVPLLRVGDLPEVDVSDVIVVPALPKPPLPPPKARTGNPGGRIRAKHAVAALAAPWRFTPVDIPDGIVEEGLGAEGVEGGIEGGLDYGAGWNLPGDVISDVLSKFVSEPVEPTVRAGGEVKPPRLVRRVDPAYPEIARQARVEGMVILEATTDVYGRVSGVRVLRSIPLLDEAAIEAVRHWIYEPLVINGRPRPVTFTVTVTFVLK